MKTITADQVMAPPAPTKPADLNLNVSPDLPSPKGGSIQSLAWSRDGGRLAVTSFAPPSGKEGVTDNGETWALDPAQGAFTQLKAAPVLSTDGLSWAPDSYRLAVLEKHGVRIHHADVNETLAWIQSAVGPEAQPISLSWSRSGDLVVAYMQADGMSIETYEGTRWRGQMSKLPPNLPRQVASVGWSPKGNLLGMLLTDDDDDNFVLAAWDGDSITIGPHGRGWVIRPVVSQAWSPVTQRIALAVQPLAGSGTDLADYTDVIVWDPPNGYRQKRFDLGPFGLFGAVWSPDEKFISCTTGEDILLLDADKLDVIMRLDSFYSAAIPPRPEFENVRDDEVGLSGLGFTIRHNWSPDGTWLVAGNVGGLRFWSANRLLDR